MPKRKPPAPGPHPNLTDVVPDGRKKPVLQITITPEAKEMAAELARERGQSVSALVEELVRGERKRRDRRDR